MGFTHLSPDPPTHKDGHNPGLRLGPDSADTEDCFLISSLTSLQCVECGHTADNECNWRVIEI